MHEDVVPGMCAEAKQTWPTGVAASEAGAAAAGVEEMAVTKEGMACASSSLDRHAPGPAHTQTHSAPTYLPIWTVKLDV